jgi:serine protease Do
LRGITPVALGSAVDAEAGEALMASVGGSGSDVAMTQLVSKRAFSGYWEYHIESAIFTSPPIGNHSGAPLFNQRGELLGIGSLFVGDALGDNRRLPGNMFVPVDLLKPILAELQQTGTTRVSRRPWLGLTSTEQGGRVQVVRVNKDSPAEVAGLGPGDVVLAVDGARVSSLESFYKKVWDHADPNDEIKLTVLQGAEIKVIPVKAIDRMTVIKKPSGI